MRRRETHSSYGSWRRERVWEREREGKKVNIYREVSVNNKSAHLSVVKATKVDYHLL